MNAFWVYYSFGGCQDGDHSWGMEDYKTREQALLRISELIAQARMAGEDDSWQPILIEGRCLDW